MQNTVSRMIIGGSTGLRMMIALPRVPPRRPRRRPRDVVWVNSSMLARVPGPAERDATEATISAYGTGVTRETACTIGIVACPPQVIIETFGAAMCSRRFTGGQTIGPRCGRGEVDGLDARLGVARGVGQVRGRRGGLEDDLRERVLAQQPVDAVGRRGDAFARGRGRGRRTRRRRPCTPRRPRRCA